jgi:hypothetical protein
VEKKRKEGKRGADSRHSRQQRAGEVVIIMVKVRGVVACFQVTSETANPLSAQFRMSMKSDKGESKSHHVSIPHKDAIAIVPPKKVS